MICITGIPGTGKTTICKMLNDYGIECLSLNKIALDYGAIKGDAVDVDMLAEKSIKADVVESHYSHLLACRYVIILEDSEEKLRERMIRRGYPEAKIDENLDAQRCGVIYYEAADRLPVNRIFVVRENSRSIDEVFNEVLNIISGLHNKVN
jgi:adenylate kinase